MPAVDGGEIEILITKTYKQSLAPDRAGTLTKYGSKALISCRRLKLGDFVESECDSRRRGSDGQLRNLYPNRLINWGESGQEICAEVSRVEIASVQHRLLRVLCCTETKRTIYLRDQANQLSARGPVQRAYLSGRRSRGQQERRHRHQNGNSEHRGLRDSFG